MAETFIGVKKNSYLTMMFGPALPPGRSLAASSRRRMLSGLLRSRPCPSASSTETFPSALRTFRLPFPSSIVTATATTVCGPAGATAPALTAHRGVFRMLSSDANATATANGSSTRGGVWGALGSALSRRLFSSGKASKQQQQQKGGAAETEAEPATTPEWETIKAEHGTVRKQSLPLGSRLLACLLASCRSSQSFLLFFSRVATGEYGSVIPPAAWKMAVHAYAVSAHTLAAEEGECLSHARSVSSRLLLDDVF